ncbi:MAG: methylated-DNA--[protein]-cysteine S-methyltransferase [Verrucomicrobiae bacterium]|nr:methylated-DNA--[protein]-cysteine S-methyltransferase [Verrucomicrobiae bacterium]
MKTIPRYLEAAIATADGTFMALYSSKGLVGLNFPARRGTTKPGAAGAVPEVIRKWHSTTSVALKRALTGKSPRELPPLDVSSGTNFQQAVWRELCRLKTGETCSYGELARRIGRPNAGRAVGGACGANLIPVLIPCHRVLAANQKPGGFSGGLDWKRKLLEREGVAIQ